MWFIPRLMNGNIVSMIPEGLAIDFKHWYDKHWHDNKFLNKDSK